MGPAFQTQTHPMIRRRVFHPILFALYPVAALLAFNIDWLQPTDAIRAVVLAIGGTFILLALLARLTGDWHRAGLLTSVLVIAFFSYGHLYEGLKAVGLGASLGRHRYLAPLFLVAMALLLWWIARRMRNPAAATSVLNVVAAATLILPTLTLGRWAYASLAGGPVEADEGVTLHLPQGERPPDIYYIIVDGYARRDTLQRVYEFDNDEFLSFLEGEGFYIADDSRSNYAQTGLSLASSLNMDYLDAILSPIEEARGREALWQLIKHSEVRRQLESLGYVTVAFSTGLAGTEWTDADYYFTAGSIDEDLGLVGANPFEGLLIQTSLLRLPSDGVVALPRFVPDVRYPYEVHRARIRHIFDRLKDLPETDEPKFVFAHVIAPHPPFVFAADGSPVTPNVPFTLRFTFDAGDPEASDYIKGYRDQTIFVNTELEEAISAILARSEVPPVIIVQGDHGPDSNSGRQSYIQERMTNLNAYLIPDGTDGLYPGLTPVNSFRLVFNRIFGGTYAALPDRVLYSQYDTPYDYLDATDDITSP